MSPTFGSGTEGAASAAALDSAVGVLGCDGVEGREGRDSTSDTSVLALPSSTDGGGDTGEVVGVSASPFSVTLGRVFFKGSSLVADIVPLGIGGTTMTGGGPVLATVRSGELTMAVGLVSPGS